MNEIKICSLCRKPFPSTPQFFYRNSYSGDGFRSECKSCNKKLRDNLGRTGIAQGLTTRDPRLDLKKGVTMKSFRDDCKDIYAKSKKTIGYNEITFDLGDEDAGIKLDCDWHIGNEMTNLDKWSEDIEITSEMDRCFTIMDGDYTDNLDAIKKQYESLIPVHEAKNLVNDAVKLLKGQILGIVQGCHDEWFFSQDSWDISQYLASHTEQGYWLGFRSLVNIKVGENIYSGYVRHKYKRFSSDNLTWGMIYKARLLPRPVDFMFGAHNHHLMCSTKFERGRIQYYLKGGSYKPYDRFLEHHDVEPAQPIMPGIILSARKRNITMLHDFRLMQDYL